MAYTTWKCLQSTPFSLHFLQASLAVSLVLEGWSPSPGVKFPPLGLGRYSVGQSQFAIFRERLGEQVHLEHGPDDAEQVCSAMVKDPMFARASTVCSSNNPIISS